MLSACSKCLVFTQQSYVRQVVSKLVPQRKLHDPEIESAHYVAIASRAKGYGKAAEVGVIENVEKLNPNWNLCRSVMTEFP